MMRIYLTLFFVSLVVFSSAREQDFTDKVLGMYNGAEINNVLTNPRETTLEITHNKTDKQVTFNKNGEWDATTYGINKSKLPKKIKKIALSSTRVGVGAHSIKEVSIIETPKRNLYKIKLNKWFSDEDPTMYVSFDGKLF